MQIVNCAGIALDLRSTKDKRASLVYGACYRVDEVPGKNNKRLNNCYNTASKYCNPTLDPKYNISQEPICKRWYKPEGNLTPQKK